MTEKRGGFKNWTVLLAIAAFSLSLLGTFLVRSGVLSSVHAFATDPRRGIFILIFLAAVVGGSLYLFALRAPKVGLGGAFGLVSRESMLLMNNVLLLVACGSVLLGTLYPLFIDALGLGKLSVGPPYFNSVFVPLMVPVLLLMAPGPLMRWKHARLADTLKPLWPAVLGALTFAIAVPLAYGQWSPLVALGLLLAAWIVGAGVVGIVARLRGSQGGWFAQPRSWWGMHFAHLGVAAFVVGVTLVSAYQEEKDVRMEPDDTVSVGGYGFRFVGVRPEMGPNYRAMVGEVELSKDGKVLKTLHPEKRSYLSSAMPMTEAAIDAGILRDVYVSLGEPIDERAWSVRVYYKPFVDWIWGGCLLMALGGLLALSDRRYRLKKAVAATQATQGAAA